jgi:hypothetical protein
LVTGALLVAAALLVGSAVGLVGALIVARATRPRALPPLPAQPAPAPAPVPTAAVVPTRLAEDGPDAVRERHRELYDTAYSAQLDRVDRLRRTLGTQLANGEPHRQAEEAEPEP